MISLSQTIGSVGQIHVKTYLGGEGRLLNLTMSPADTVPDISFSLYKDETAKLINNLYRVAVETFGPDFADEIRRKA